MQRMKSTKPTSYQKALTMETSVKYTDLDEYIRAVEQHLAGVDAEERHEIVGGLLDHFRSVKRAEPQRNDASILADLGSPEEIGEAAGQGAASATAGSGTQSSGEDGEMAMHLRRANRSLILAGVSVLLSFTFIAPLIIAPFGLTWAVQVLRRTADDKVRFDAARGRAWIAIALHTVVALFVALIILGTIHWGAAQSTTTVVPVG